MQASGNGGLIPPPRAPGLPGSRLNLAQVGQARLALGGGLGRGVVVDAKGHGLENSFCYFK